MSASEDPAELRAAADELEAAAEECRDRAEQLQEASDLATQADGALEALERHDEVSDELAVSGDWPRRTTRATPGGRSRTPSGGGSGPTTSRRPRMTERGVSPLVGILLLLILTILLAAITVVLLGAW